MDRPPFEGMGDYSGLVSNAFEGLSTASTFDFRGVLQGVERRLQERYELMAMYAAEDQSKHQEMAVRR